MTESYLGIVIVTVVGILNAALLLGLSHLFSETRPTAAKRSPYESGMIPLGDTRRRFSVQFYIVAMLFIVFDIETVFFFPWAVVYRDLGLFGFLEMLVFIGVLLAGLAYAWRKGALQWD
jgi:NADH-quinone oxidoreductase subunit A